MAWVTISLRKMALRARQNNLNARLMELSQQQQSMQMAAGYALSAMNAQKDQALMEAQDRYYAGIEGLQYGDSNSQTMAALRRSELDYQREQLVINSVFTAAEEGQRNMTKVRESAISMEIEILNTQLMAVNAEYEALEKGLESDIKKDTIKLG